MAHHPNRPLIGVVAVCLFLLFVAPAAWAEVWTLTGKDYPVLPQVITEGSYANGQRSSIKLRRIREREVAYIKLDERYGQRCISVFEWDEPKPQVSTDQEVWIQTRSRWDIRQGETCPSGRIHAETWRGHDAHIITQTNGLSVPSGSLGPPAATARFRVIARNDVPHVNQFMLDVVISDGGVTGKVVARYTYTKTSGGTVGPGSGGGIRPPQPHPGGGPLPPAAPGGHTAGDVDLTSRLVNYTASFQSLNYPNLFIRHRNYLAELTAIQSNLDRNDGSFRMVPGLAGRGVSFESVNYPGYFLRHQNFRIKLHKRNNTQLYLEDATFIPRPGLANGQGVSFESVNYPGRFIRHRDFHLYLESGSSQLFLQDATFNMTRPFAH